MKVCTDSCLFGAWMANKIEQKNLQPENILDIGAGTGLLSLLLAQKSHSLIDAVEIEENAYRQTVENFLKSPWRDRLHALWADVNNWHPSSRYDLIISNPPFYQNNLKASERNKNYARHEDGLTLPKLLECIDLNLSAKGHFAILLPYQGIANFKKQSLEKDFYLQEELLVKQTPSHSYFRGLLLFGTKPAAVISNDELIIKDEAGNYTHRFNFLLKDYYLDNLSCP